MSDTENMEPELRSDERVAEHAFALGDYTTAALQAASDELRGSAYIMLGHHEAGMPLLERLSTPRAIFYAGFGLWGLGFPDEAYEKLGTVVDDHEFGTVAQKLRRHIKRRDIKLLLQGRDDPECPDYDFVGTVRSIPEIELKTVGYSKRSDITIDHTTTYDDVMSRLPAGWHPDLFLSHMVEDNPPPKGIEHASFPTFCHTQDYDRHFHHCAHYLKLFDGIIALGRADHADFRQITGASVFVYPKLLGTGLKQREVRRGGRSLDVFVSGSLFGNTQAKAEYLFDISQLPSRYSVELLDGYLSQKDYYKSLSKAKVTFTYVNRDGLINGRAIEAISQGTCALYQAGGELGIFLREEDGAIPYHPGNSIPVLRRVVDEWETRYRNYARNGSRKVFEIFKIEKCIERYLYFLTLCAARGVPRPVRRLDPVHSQIRYPNRSPKRTLFHFDRSLAKLSALQQGFRDELEGSKLYAHRDACGESLLYSYLLCRPASVKSRTLPAPLRWMYDRVAQLAITTWATVEDRQTLRAIVRQLSRVIPFRAEIKKQIAVSMTPGQVDSLLERAASTYASLADEYSTRIAAPFNLARIRWELGDFAAAKASFTRILSAGNLTYEPWDLLFWKEFHEDYFDYEAMMVELVLYAKDNDARHLRIVETAIRNSARLYLAMQLTNEGNIEAAKKVLEQSAGEGRPFPLMMFFLASLESQTGNPQRAEQYLRDAIHHDRSIIARATVDELAKLREFGCDVHDFIAQQRILNARCRRDRLYRWIFPTADIPESTTPLLRRKAA